MRKKRWKYTLYDFLRSLLQQSLLNTGEKTRKNGHRKLSWTSFETYGLISVGSRGKMTVRTWCSSWCIWPIYFDRPFPIGSAVEIMVITTIAVYEPDLLQPSLDACYFLEIDLPPTKRARGIIAIFQTGDVTVYKTSEVRLG